MCRQKWFLSHELQAARFLKLTLGGFGQDGFWIFFFFCQQLDTYLWWLLYSLKWYFYAKLKIPGREKIFNPEYTHSCPAPGKDSSACVRELLRPAQQVGIESGQCTVWEKETRDRIKVLKMGLGDSRPLESRAPFLRATSLLPSVLASRKYLLCYDEIISLLCPRSHLPFYWLL